MKSLLINGRFCTQRLTGVQRYARALTQQLQDLYPESISVATPARSLTGVFGHGWEQLILPWLCRDQGLWSPANTGPLTVTQQVVTIHDVAPLDHPEWFSPQFAGVYRILIPALARRVRGILTVSDCSKHRIARACKIPPERIRVVPPGIDPGFRPLPESNIQVCRQRYHLDRPYLLTLGSLDPRKNLTGLLQAWLQIQSHWPDLELVVVGAGSPHFAQIQLGDPGDPAAILTRVRWLGYCPDADLPALYGGAIGFAYPSLYEGFGLPVVEAMACGVPVLTGVDGSLQEASAGAALEVDPTQIEAIAAGLERLLGHSDQRDRLRAAGFRRVQDLSWRSSAHRVAAELEAFGIG